MHDHGAVAYDRDTFVVDLDDDTPSIAIPRATTEELLMQVYVRGAWHRRMPDLKETACELAIDTQRCPVRRPELKGDLCAKCHTVGEVNRATDNNRKDIDP